MSADPNVARGGDGKRVKILTDKKIVSVKWLDNGKSVKGVKKNEFPVEPFEYGVSLSARVAKFELK